MPRDTIQNAIKKGTGELGAENYETIQYEGYGPSGVAIMIDGLTNNRARTAPELRMIFEKNGGNLATSGSVAFQFTKRGVITIKSDAVEEDKLMELALDAGAEDVTNEGEAFVVADHANRLPQNPRCDHGGQRSDRSFRNHACANDDLCRSTTKPPGGF